MTYGPGELMKRIDSCAIKTLRTPTGSNASQVTLLNTVVKSYWHEDPVFSLHMSSSEKILRLVCFSNQYVSISLARIPENVLPPKF